MVDSMLGAVMRALLAMPPRLLRVVAGPERRNERGAVLDLQMQAVLRLGERLRLPKPHEQAPADARATMDRQARMAEPSPVAVARVQERSAPGPAGELALRVYVPRESAEPLPVLVYYHGGGHCAGSLASHDGVCRALCREADCVVVSVDYRLAPEHPFPAAFEDAVAAFEHVVEQAASFGGEPGWVAVGGDSAGGNLAAAVCHHQRDAGRPRPAFQLLVYPLTDLGLSHESHRLFTRGLLLDAETMVWYRRNYAPEPDQVRDPRASPHLAASFADLPPALVVTAGFDPLRDEGEAYAARLRAAGVAVLEQREPTLVHGFANVPGVRAAAAARARMASSLGEALRGARPAQAAARTA